MAKGEAMLDEAKTALVSRNITVNKKRTSIRLETQMWGVLKDIATREKCTIHDICGLISNNKSNNITLTAAIRIFLILYYKSASTEDGHKRAGHGGFSKMLERAANVHPTGYNTSNQSNVDYACN